MENWQFIQKQSMPYEAKVRHAEIRAKEFYNQIVSEYDGNLHVSVGGLDSITLFLFLKQIGLEVPGISVSSLEDKSIQTIHKKLGIIRLKSCRTKSNVIKEFGFPVLSKQVAGKIDTLQNPTDRNKTVRHAIMTGDTGKRGGYRKGTRMKLPKKWLELFAGYENEKYGTNYQIAPFLVSNKCCYHLKEKPCNNWAKENNSYPYLGLMASEGGQREKALIKNGCNYYGKTTIRSAPFAIFHRQDLLQLALELKIPVPEIYGTIERKKDGTLYTTKAQRTGCSMCGFGIQLEKRPHRFDRLYEDNPKEWEYWMFSCCVDEKTGERYGWARVLEYIGVGWNPEDFSYRDKRKVLKLHQQLEEHS